MTNKNILLLAPVFFGYAALIKKELENRGAHVTYVNSESSYIYDTIYATSKNLQIFPDFWRRAFEDSIYNTVKTQKYDIIVLINGKLITHRLTERLRNNVLQVNGKMILYYWDKMSVIKDDAGRQADFDVIKTFDLEDYRNNSNTLGFLPLFFENKYYSTDSLVKPQYDLSTIGTFKINRYDLIERLMRNNPSIKIDSYLYTQKLIINLHKLLRKKYKNVDLTKLSYKKLSALDIIERYKNSCAVLDIPITGQNGLTMRTFECLAMHKKIVTTNVNVKQYDFYHPDNIFILDENNLVLPSEIWFRKPYTPIGEDVIMQYSLSNWLNNLLTD